jgi:CheY-like chemotaxis protein
LAQQERPDLILLDISLPGMDGYEVAHQLRADPELGRTPLIAVTAHAMAGDQERIFAGGFDDYLAKPINEDELWAKIEKHLS